MKHSKKKQFTISSMCQFHFIIMILESQRNHFDRTNVSDHFDRTNVKSLLLICFKIIIIPIQSHYAMYTDSFIGHLHIHLYNNL